MNEKLSADDIGSVVSFLTIYGVIALESTCKELRSQVKPHWADYVFRSLFFVEIDPVRRTIEVNNAKALLIAFSVRIKDLNFARLNDKFLASSSIDRQEESCSNLIAPSPCHCLFESFCTNSTLSDRPREVLGYASQMRCRCLQERPCYWSSHPSKVPHIFEWIDVQFRSPTIIVLGFTVTPYQAFFHPDSPVYGPKCVKLQIFAKESPEKLLYESDTFDVPNTWQHHTFPLPQPYLCIDGQARLVLSGMHQRQTIGIGNQGAAAGAGGGVGDVHDDYYMCLSYAAIIGIDLPYDCSQWPSTSPTPPDRDCTNCGPASSTSSTIPSDPHTAPSNLTVFGHIDTFIRRLLVPWRPGRVKEEEKQLLPSQLTVLAEIAQTLLRYVN